ncbi:MAG: hypothetical protein KC609_19590 [Myxococcales bacterium]|nr:hypothetical protein [Myxococcales bacterium]
MKRAILHLLLLAVAVGSAPILGSTTASADTVKKNDKKTKAQDGVEIVLDGDDLGGYRVYRTRTYYYRPGRRYYRQPYRRPYLDEKTSFYFGIGGFGTGVITTKNTMTQLIRSGGGYNFFVGWRFHRFAALELGYNGSFHALQAPNGTTPVSSLGTGMFQAITLDAKIFFLPMRGSRIDPFIQIGGGGYFFFRNDLSHRELSGGGFHVGIGLDIRLNRFIALGGRLLYKGIYIDNSSQFINGIPTETAFLNQIGGEVNIQIHF